LAFVLGVILIGPLASLPILRVNRPLASGLLAVLMAAAFAYGFQSHFLIAGPDNVSVVATNVWTLVFVVTAMGIGVLELVGIGVAAILFVRAVRNPSGHLGPRT
jgi:general stress protein CsbA